MSRLNDEDQNSFAKIATAALTGSVLAAAFYRSGANKLLADGLPKATRFLGAVSDDLSERRFRDFDGDTISRLTKKHITDSNSTLKTIARENNKIDLRINTNSFASAVVKMKELDTNADKMLRKVFNGNYSDDVTKRLNNRYNISKKFGDETLENLNSLVRHELSANDLVLSERGINDVKLNNELIDKYLDPEKFNLGKDKDNFFNDLVNMVKDEKEAAYKDFKSNHSDELGNIDLVKNIKAELTGKSFEEAFGTKQDEVVNLLSMERGLTVGDYIDNADKFNDQIIKIGDGSHSLKDMVSDLARENEEIRNILLDAKNLKINSENEIIDYQGVDNIRKNFMEGLAGTLPGKLMKVTDALSAEDPGIINMLEKGKAAPLIAASENMINSVNNNYIQIMGKFYDINSKNELSHVSELDGFSTRTSRHGSYPRLMSKMFGLASEREATNKYTSWLDINTSNEANVIDDLTRGDGVVGNISRKIFGGKKYNIVDKLVDEDLAEKDVMAYRKNLRDMSNVFSSITKAPSVKTLKSMEDATTNNVSREILQALQSSDQEEMMGVLSQHVSSFRSDDLKQLIRSGTRNRSDAARMLSIKSNMLTNEKNVMKFKDIVRREAFKEVLLNESINEKTGIVNHSNILVSLRRAGLSGREYKNAKNLTHWSVMQNQANAYNSIKSKDIDIVKAGNAEVLDMINNNKKRKDSTINAEYIKDFTNAIYDIKDNYKELTTRIDDRDRPGKVVRAAEHADNIFIRKAYKPEQYVKNMLNDMNDLTKMKANTKRFGMQFVAGKNTPEYVTEYTMAPYFFTERLIEPFNKVGLGFSSKNMGSTGDMWKAIMTKRVMPAAAGITAFSYLNYEAKNLTGTSITGAMAQGVANTDLGIRKIADLTGIGSLLNAERRLNPMTQYWLGEDYQDSNERKDYYENGYDAMRKGRWWAFGSASEFRGGKITYWQPNFVKRANSDWKDIGLYGSSEEKWKHSWLPTLRHPFAPIRKALDPYWLERKHYYDRPYMETAPLFSAGTPWGAVLNPTIGEIIKPIRKMHKNEIRRGLVDPKTLIAERNERIRHKAVDKNRENLFKVSSDGVRNMNYTSSALADPENAMVTFKVGQGRVQAVDYNGVGYQEGVAPASDVNTDNGHISIGGDSGFIDAIESTSIGAGISNSIRQAYSPMETIRIANQDVMKKATRTSNGSLVEKANLATMPARAASLRAITRQDESDLLLTTSKHDFVNDAIFSGKQLSGIYGFLAGFVGPDKGRQVRFENADKMSSFKSNFWDANVGGIGGGVMEIARRFFPHDDHNWTNINPVRNTMPDWMPERFQTGDPFRKLPKGEMRLPGAGYESIHKLRSDEYGKYGALDRMRILGDIAPWSDEYKTWRDIAQKTVTDQSGKKEIQAIKKRVEKQSRSHEFYSYKFLGNPTEINNIVVDKIDGDTITSVDGQSYSLAGIKLAKGANLSDYVGEGMRVQVEHLKNKAHGSVISSAIYLDGDNINQKLLNSGMASQKENGDAMDSKALTGQLGQLYGSAMEAIAHAPIPFIHSKVMRVDTALESYKNERVYGTPYSTWDHPIKGFIAPAFQKSWGRGAIGQGVALGGWALAEYAWDNTDKIVDGIRYLGFNASETGINRAASMFMNATNPGAFAGSMMAAIPTGLMGDSGGLKGLLSASVFGSGVQEGIGRNAARLGATAMIAGYAITRTDKPMESTAIGSVAGIALAKQLNYSNFGTKEGAIAGAAVGFALSAIRNPRWNKEKMFGIYTPEDTKKRWDIDEYYDRLEYIKYKGLFEKSARKARLWEGTSIKKIINANEYSQKANKKKIEKLNNRLQKISNSNLEDRRKEELVERLNSKIYGLSNSETMLRGGKYTKAAIAYKQAMDSTIYGLSEDSTTQEVLRSIPKADKDFFMDFMKEKDKKKRKEILKYVSPYQRRALQIAWGEKKIDSPNNNSEYFKNHFLPGVFWAGWKPQVDMENVKIKTIENEGMLLSDFGIYESQSQEPDAILAPSVGTFDKSNAGGLGLQARLQGALNGTGLLGVKVSVSPSSSDGIEVIANVTNSLKITEYKIREGINKITGARMFYN